MIGSIQKRGKCYYIVFRITDYKTGKKKQKWLRAGRLKRQADETLSEMMGEVHTGTFRQIKKSTFAQFSKLWLESYAETICKPSTLRSYQSIIRNHFSPVFGDMAMTAISTEMLQRYVAKRLKKVKPKTVVNEIVPLKKMFKHAVKWGYIKFNPAIDVERPKVEEEEMEILIPKEIRILLDNVTPKYKPLFLTAILTGMRRGELLGLQWGDIDNNHNQIHVKRSMWEGQFYSPKSKASKRKIDMTPTLVLELKKHKLVCPVSEHELVFCNPFGKPLDPDNMIKREFIPALRRAKIRKIRFHDLRHTNVALRIEQNQNIKYIQKQIGHASIQTTLDRYGHLIKEVNQEQAIKLDSILGFVENSGSLKNPVSRLLAKTGNFRESEVGENLRPLKKLVAGTGFEPATFGL